MAWSKSLLAKRAIWDSEVWYLSGRSSAYTPGNPVVKCGVVCGFQFSSLTQSCPTLWDPMDCRTPASLSITNSQSLLKLMSIESVMTSNHLTPCWPLLLLPSIFPSIRVFSSESVLHIRWPKYWSFSFSISPSSEYLGLISFSQSDSQIGWTIWISLQSKRLSRVFSNTTVQKHQFFSSQLSL